MHSLSQFIIFSYQKLPQPGNLNEKKLSACVLFWTLQIQIQKQQQRINRKRQLEKWSSAVFMASICLITWEVENSCKIAVSIVLMRVNFGLFFSPNTDIVHQLVFFARLKREKKKNVYWVFGQSFISENAPHTHRQNFKKSTNVSFSNRTRTEWVRIMNCWTLAKHMQPIL